MNLKPALLIMTLALALVSCKEGGRSCMKRLNYREYASVVTDPSCSTYERGSAELGLAGFEMSRILAISEDASPDYRSALGISSSVTDWETFSGREHYIKAQILTGDASGNEYEGEQRSGEDIEVHYFATLGSFLAQTYILLDTTADGSISDQELQNFTKLNSSTAADYGSNDLTDSGILQFVKSDGSVYLLDLVNNYCETDSNQDGVWGGSTASMIDCIASSAEITAAAGSTLSISGSCNEILKVNSVQKLFTQRLNPDNNAILLTDQFVATVEQMKADLTALNIGSDSSLYTLMSDFTSKMDNGGTCTSTSLTEINQIITLANNAAISAQSSYASYNLINLSDFTTVSDNSVTAPTSFSSTVGTTTLTFSCTNSSSLKGRLVYKNSAGTGYTPYLAAASSDLFDVFANMIILQQDSVGKTKPNVQNDQIVSFKELMCMSN